MDFVATFQMLRYFGPFSHFEILEHSLELTLLLFDDGSTRHIRWCWKRRRYTASSTVSTATASTNVAATSKILLPACGYTTAAST